MYAVGVGKAVEAELREIASEPADKHFYYTADFTAINQIAENLKLNICAGQGARQAVIAYKNYDMIEQPTGHI